MRFLLTLALLCAALPGQIPLPPWAPTERVDFVELPQPAQLNERGDIVAPDALVPLAPTFTFGNATQRRASFYKRFRNGGEHFTIVLGGVLQVRTWKLTASGSILIAGEAAAGQFAPSPGAYRSAPAGDSGPFLCRFTATGERSFCSYTGAPSLSPPVLAEDAAGSVYLYVDRPTPLPEPGDPVTTAGRLLKFHPAGTRLEYLTGVEAGPGVDLRIEAGGVAAVLANRPGPPRESTTLFRFSAAGDRVLSSVEFPLGARGRFAPDGSVILLEQDVLPFGNAPPRFRYRLLRYSAAGARLYRYPLPASILTANFFDADANGSVTIASGSSAGLPVKLPVEQCGSAALIRLSPLGDVLQATFLRDGVKAIAVTTTGMFLVQTGPELSLRTVLSRWGPKFGAAIRVSCAGNAASLTNRLAPGMLLSVFGENLGPRFPESAIPRDGRYPFSLQGIGVTVNGIPAPILYVSPAQINMIVPWSLPVPAAVPASVPAEVCVGGRAADLCLNTFAQDRAVGVFEVSGWAIAQNQDGSLNGPTNPAVAGSIVTLWGTGFGPVLPRPADGGALNLPLPLPRLPISLRGTYGPPGSPPRQLETRYVGLAPGAVAGLWQCNIVVPGEVPDGNMIVRISAGSEDSGWSVILAARAR